MSGWAGGAAGVRGQERLTGGVSGREPLGKHSSDMSGLGSVEGPMCEERRREMVKGRFSQCCDMFVMFSHWGDCQTFRFAVWHLPLCGTADTSPDKVGKEELGVLKKRKRGDATR